MYWQDVEKLVRICATVMGNRVLTPPKAKQNHRQMSCAACRPQAPGTRVGTPTDTCTAVFGAAAATVVMGPMPVSSPREERMRPC